ncbi:unnamed protein product [Gongylonema pulchrum]|uniref:Uncharacterized protein n=1 Tax=Gongylonema pulchrum TaxID=637853 RepID=A0A183DAP6_9BILA|nr:unnamed protein product [Gongylonema pulchrum]
MGNQNAKGITRPRRSYSSNCTSERQLLLVEPSAIIRSSSAQSRVDSKKIVSKIRHPIFLTLKIFQIYQILISYLKPQTHFSTGEERNITQQVSRSSASSSRAPSWVSDESFSISSETGSKRETNDDSLRSLSREQSVEGSSIILGRAGLYHFHRYWLDF